MKPSNSAKYTEHQPVDVSMKSLSIEKRELGPANEALFLVLPYLDVMELIVMNQVCLSLKEAVDNDVLAWIEIVVDRPLNSRLSDEILMKLCSKANGKLRLLDLKNCVRISDDGLQRVVERNPLIRKLHVAGCTGLTPEGITRAVKTLTLEQNNLKSLHIDGIYNFNSGHLKALQTLLQIDPSVEKLQSLQYYHLRFSNKENDRAIDVEVCPKCGGIGKVYDCPRETCRKRSRLPYSGDCRGCWVCISRCEGCGVCISCEEPEELLCGDNVCSDCWLLLPKCFHCNKPYCEGHAHRMHASICEVCYAPALGYGDGDTDCFSSNTC